LFSTGTVFYSIQYAVRVTGGTAVWKSENDSFYETAAGFTGIATINVGSTSSSTINNCTATSNANNPVFQTQNTAVLHIRGCHINAGTAQFWADSHSLPGGPIYDDGANVITGSTSSDAIPTASHGVWGIGTGVGTANTTLFLVAPASTTNAFTNTTATTVSGVAPFTGTLSDLVCTSTAAGVNASSGAVTVRTAPLSTGTFAASTITATFGTTTAASDHTHTSAINQGQPIQFQVTTQVAETLAGVQCRVSLH
jgi:hypothetical protein